MSRSCKKAGRRVNRQRLSKSELCDVTLNDFANSSVASPSGRMKKTSIQVNQMIEQVKQLNIVEFEGTWEERLDMLEESEVNSDNETIVGKPSRRRKRTVTSEGVEEQSGNDYPIDIWFLISEYISPEDVGKFSAICKTSLAVVSTARFWFNLYKRYYRSVANLPEQLQPECMVRRYGLRTHVIRALHFMYPPFVEKLKPQVIFNDDPHLLTKRLCIMAWSQKIKNHWLFSFKLKKVGALKRGIEGEERKAKPDLLEMLEDITANVDDNCKILQATCLNYINLPMLSGQTLSGVSLKVSPDMRYHKLQLDFGSGPIPDLSSSPVVLDPVVNVRVLDWWHPSFPHSGGLNTSLFSEETASQQYPDELEF